MSRSCVGCIGVLLTDTSRSPAYSRGPRQTLYCEPFSLFHRFKAELLEDASRA